MATTAKVPAPIADVGLTCLNNPEDAVTEYVLESSLAWWPLHKLIWTSIIFVHGLQGHPKNTWTYESKLANSPSPQVPSPSKDSRRNKSRVLGIFPKSLKGNKSKPIPSQNEINQQIEGSNQENNIFWPGDLLKDDVPKARIIMFGYNTNITEGYHAAHQGNIFSHARDLLYGLEAKRRNVPDRDLVFIAHSLGGILVKEVLRRSEADPDAKIRKIFSSTTGIFFFGTPHRGSKDWASFGEGVAGVAGRLLGVDTNNQVIHALLPSGPELELCRESFAIQWVKRGDGLTVRAFQESRAIIGVKWGRLNQLV